jgi:hypothetical protein
LGDKRFLIQLVPVAIRGNVEVHGVRVWASFDGGTTYQQIPDDASMSSFFMLGFNTSTIGAGDTSFNYQGYGIDQNLIVSQTPGQQADDNLLCIIDDEIMSVGTISPVSGTTLNCAVVRGRYASAAVSHAAVSPVVFCFRHDLLLLDHVNFIPGTTVLFKFQPFTEELDYDLASITPVSYTIIGYGDIPAPVFYPTAGDFIGSMAVNVTDPASGIVTRYTVDGTGVTQASPIWPQSAGVNIAITITTNTTFRVRFYANDARYSNETIGIYTQIPDTAAPTNPLVQCGAPKWSFSGTANYTSGNITLSNTTSLATIKYSKNGGAITNYSSPVSMACTTTGDKIEFWAIKAGLSDSAHKTFDNTKIQGAGGGFYGGGGSTGTPPRMMQ